MLDLPLDPWAQGQPLPLGWHFTLLAADTPRSVLRADGFPGLGVPMPDLNLPRLMLGSRTVSFRQSIPIGTSVMRRSALCSVVHKATATGPMAVVTVGHELHVGARTEPAVVETQTYLLMPARVPGGVVPEAPPGVPVLSAHHKVVRPDETLLFQYSALGFNSHRIHIDREHARQVEGFADLVVNGGLATLLLTEFLRNELAVAPSGLKVRHLAPLYCNRAMTLTADERQGQWHLNAYDDQHRLAVAMEVSV